MPAWLPCSRQEAVKRLHQNSNHMLLFDHLRYLSKWSTKYELDTMVYPGRYVETSIPHHADPLPQALAMASVAYSPTITIYQSLSTYAKEVLSLKHIHWYKKRAFKTIG